MGSHQRVSAWARASLYFGIVWLAISMLVLVEDHYNGQPWWEQNDLAKARNALDAGTARAVTLITVSTGATLVGTMLCIAAVGHCWLSFGAVAGLGQACLGLLLTGLGTTVTVYVAIKQGTRPNPWMFIAMPVVLTILGSWMIWRNSLRMNSTLATMKAAETTAAAAAAASPRDAGS
jgi:hypothetical protein